MSNQTIVVGAGSGYDKVRLEQRDVAAPGPGEITVRLRANSLNFHDYAVVTGLWGALSEDRVPMADGAGEVEAIGEGVTEFAVGDHVVSTFFTTWYDGETEVEGFDTVPGDGIDGYACERVTRSAQAFTPAPSNYTPVQAATLTTAGLTAWRALMEDGALKPGETVLVQGTGGVSIFALQFAKHCGATVIATSSSDAKLERLGALGADHLINYKQDKNWGQTARDITGGIGVDHVIEVGGPDTLAQSMTAVRVRGHIAVIGVLSGVAGEVSLMPMLAKQIRLQGVLVGNRRQQQDMVRAIEASNIEPLIDKTFPLQELADAFRYQETNQHFGKICLTI
ncbi:MULTISPECIES: NAD(P)-dependent alcohol dehydrogenase [Salinisphaera]|jgi:NADPH:quinone reductase-like Zn-dependent oxidoreductase|uniref:Alcohol dehydrogenase protein n=2 Tax=Salinisphaera TaxID=180541 RepID=U2FVS8_9GAMM|nr:MULTISPECIES: NAD(P)-dependent alcohol dehydrogenase [Salinisphaera]ERJ20004.1 alcohol dehydrogenase protein [Salinisphaera shabanensis E1L3A]MAS08872.1 NAD(P)-dependent alcohol dehydrogenase [Salinisphaera sp.]ROO28181.1 NADPH:quinone oxidoreductase [Salinisphaera halophila YIM 95161]|tara:strand:- start:553 stop:1566 length:1014 start_codon:yes stop_codon:yes gene_type:complete